MRFTGFLLQESFLIWGMLFPVVQYLSQDLLGAFGFGSMQDVFPYYFPSNRLSKQVPKEKP